jgi:hypothetical protein
MSVPTAPLNWEIWTDAGRFFYLHRTAKTKKGYFEMRRCCAALFFFSLFVIGFPVKSSSAYQSEVTDVRIFHALTGVGEADFYLNDFFAGTASFGQAVDYMIVPAGEVRVRAFAPASDPTTATALFSAVLAAGQGENINAALIGNGATAHLKTFVIECQPIEFGKGRVTFVHTLENAPELNITATAVDGTIIDLTSGLGFGEYAVVELPAGAYSLNSEGVLNNVPLSVGSGAIASAFIVPSTDGPAELRVFAGSVEADGPVGYARLVHAIPDGDPVDIYLNGTLVGANVAFGRGTVPMPLATGTYELAIFATGSETSLASGPLEISENISTLAVIHAGDYGPQMSLFTEDRNRPFDGQGGVNVVNVAASAADVTLDGQAIVSGLAAGQSSPLLVVAEGTHELTISVAGTALDTLSDFAISPHTATNLRTLIITGGGTIVLQARPVLSE